MSAYDEREKPAYPPLRIEPRYSKNPYILKWWSAKHDEILAEHIALKQWLWYWTITDEIVRITPPSKVDVWRKVDPLCKQYAWYNILMYFAVARSKELGLTRAIRRPKWKICPLCGQKFIESSLPQPLVERLGVDQIGFCAPCLRDTVLPGSGNNSATKENICRYLQDLAALIGRVPTQNFGESVTIVDP